MAYAYGIQSILDMLDEIEAQRADDDAHVLSDDDGIAALFDEIGHLYPCDNPF